MYCDDCELVNVQVSAASAQVWHDTDRPAGWVAAWSVARCTGQTTATLHRHGSLHCCRPPRGRRWISIDWFSNVV